jgi:hypothetical protein
VASAEPFVPVPVRVQRDGREEIVTVTVGITSELPKLQPVPVDQLAVPPSDPGVRNSLVPVRQ